LFTDQLAKWPGGLISKQIQQSSYNSQLSALIWAIGCNGGYSNEDPPDPAPVRCRLHPAV